MGRCGLCAERGSTGPHVLVWWAEGLCKLGPQREGAGKREGGWSQGKRS